MIYLNDQLIVPTLFPDGTSQTWKLPESLLKSHKYDVEWVFSHEGELMHLAQLKDLLDNYGITTNLRLKYLPYARQDKEVSNTTTFALKTFAFLLNQLRFEMVTIVDPHSHVALELIDNSVSVYPSDEIHQIGLMLGTALVVYPDKGAVTKYTKVYPFMHIYGEKVRDQLTGNITSYKLIGNAKNRNVLIVDDICDGGMTFKLLAKELYDAGAKEVNLFVTHGIFSKGLKTLKEAGIKRIFTADGEVFEMDNKLVYKTL
jgi:ribose-phosphate pyrophosphokinase